MAAALKVVTGDLVGRVLLLPDDGDAFLLGRSLEANLTLNGPGVEERQAVLIGDGASHRLVPVANRFSTFVDDTVLLEARVLTDGDLIRLGKHSLRYVREPSREAIGLPGATVGAGTAAPADTPCVSCGERIGPSSGYRLTLTALRLGAEVFCPRCVDGRLHLDRDLDTYRILRKIATNDQEVTYLAIDQETNDRVAIRILKADQQARPNVFRRFLVRALVGLVLDHPNFLSVRGIRISRGITFVVVDHLENSYKLETLVREHSPLSPPSALMITNQLAEVLRHAREKQVVVAKRKKSGVLVDRGNWVKVLAYDVTRTLESTVAATSAFADLAARSGVDPAALAAEVEPLNEEEARLTQLASEYAEVYSVGRILYQTLTGKPFGAGSLDRVREARAEIEVHDAPRQGPLLGTPAALIRLLERVVVPRGQDRIQTLAGYTEASKQALDGLSPQPPPAT